MLLLVPQHSAHGAEDQERQGKAKSKEKKCLFKPGQYEQKEIHSVGNRMVWVCKINPKGRERDGELF